MNAKAIVAAAIALGLGAAAVACVLADPPPIVTPPPQEPPNILVESVSPSTERILKTNPPCANSPTDCFVVPVSVDLNATVKYRVFIDLDRTSSGAQQPAVSEADDGGVLAVAPDAGAGVRVFTFSLAENPTFDPSQCHVITFIVAYDFEDQLGDFSKPFPPGGDSVSWFYQPVDDCTYYDAGVTD